MNKVFGKITLYAPIRVYGKRTIVSYGFEEVGDGENATWYEIYFSHKVSTYPPLDDIKEAILEDIDNEVKRMIIETMTWDNKQVWLSIENQQNYKTALDVAKETDGSNLPVKVKIGNEDEPTYATFSTINTLKQFWLACCNHISNCRSYGWNLKDNINWNDYKVN